ncbi:hypothetical protein CEXT_108301 [Caerostris extrusa]|uniref:Uncharacterized protein n=1 Tax=Caerostris extrusa TaxID=172846 RepID=A0AAV4REY1_CAEEX|nr:hypothetical protein CEXT_108301 [Caerostris extrusa]
MHFDAIWILSFTKTNRSFRNISRKTSSGDISLGNPYDKRALARNQPNSSKVLTAFRAMERTDFLEMHRNKLLLTELYYSQPELLSPLFRNQIQDRIIASFSFFYSFFFFHSPLLLLLIIPSIESA